MTGIDFLLMERLVIGALLAALAVGVAFGPELRRAVVRLRRREAADAAAVGLAPAPSSLAARAPHPSVSTRRRPDATRAPDACAVRGSARSQALLASRG